MELISIADELCYFATKNKIERIKNIWKWENKSNKTEEYCFFLFNIAAVFRISFREYPEFLVFLSSIL